MFMGPFEQMIPWDTKGVIGAKRFLDKIYNLAEKRGTAKASDEKLKKHLHKTIKKVGDDIELMKFNTAISCLMGFSNAWQVSKGGLDKNDLAELLKILSPFAPHLAEELWLSAGFKNLCCVQKWPKYNPKLIEEEKILLIVQINGRVRDKIEADFDINQKEAEKIVLKSEKIKNLLAGKKPVKIIFVQNRLINIVI